MTFKELREKLGWLLRNHWLLTIVACIGFGGPIRGVALILLLYLLAE